MNYSALFFPVLSCLFFFWGGLAHAQLSVQLRLSKTNYLAGEAVPVEVRISNMGGQEAILQSDSRHSWLEFIVSSTRGVPLTPSGQANFGPVKIPSGKALVRTVDLAKIYGLTQLGNHSVYAIIRMRGQEHGGFQSNRHLFTMNTVRPYWSQTVGVPGKSGVQHEYRLVIFNQKSKSELFIQLADARTGAILRTHALGEILLIHKPAVVVDSSLQMHVLYVINPRFWGYARVAPDGSFLGRDLYQPGGLNKPALAQMTNGSVQPLGAVKYDVKAAAENRRKLRKASERPDYIYE